MPPKSRWETSPSPTRSPPRKKQKKPKKDKERDKEKAKNEARQPASVPAQARKPPPLPLGPIKHLRPSTRGFGPCRSLDEYEILNAVSEGSYGIVRRGRNKATGEIVAVKSFKFNVNDGLPLTAVREIDLLRRCRGCEHVVEMREVVSSGEFGIAMILSFYPHPLHSLLHTDKRPFTPSDIKCLTHQLLSGVSFLHSHSILHRDLKPSNLLLSPTGTLVLADFGMARTLPLPPGSILTPAAQAITLWYRAPELVLGAEEYGYEADYWSVGCVVAEMWGNRPLFKSKGEIQQAQKVFEILGPPDKRTFPGFQKLKYARNITVGERRASPVEMLTRHFVELGVELSEGAAELMAGLLWLDPADRWNIMEALASRYFEVEPRMKAREMLPTFPSATSGE